MSSHRPLSLTGVSEMWDFAMSEAAGLGLDTFPGMGLIVASVAAVASSPPSRDFKCGVRML